MTATIAKFRFELIRGVESPRFRSVFVSASKFAAAAAFAFLVCPLYSHENVTTTVTYDREISRILRKKCIMCHSEDNLATPLTTYEETRPWARDIEERVLGRSMPPWQPVAGYGHFADDIGLTNREMQFIVSWVEGNGPYSKDSSRLDNFGADIVPSAKVKKPDAIQWRLGHPDAVAVLPADPAPGNDAKLVRRLTFDPGITSDRWVQSLEFQPSDLHVLRAAYFFLEETGQWVGSWTPWSTVTTLPQSVAWRISAGAHIVAELHYQASSQAAGESADRKSAANEGSLGFHFASRPPAYHPVDLLLEAKHAREPADALKLTGSVRIAADSRLLAFRPELPKGIESFEVSARKPDGTTEVLLLVRHAVPEWPTPYILSQPVALPKNTEIDLTAYARTGQDVASLRLTVSVYDAAVPAIVTTAR